MKNTDTGHNRPSIVDHYIAVPSPKRRRRKSISITIDAAILALSDVVAETEGLSRSQIIENALRAHLAGRGYSTPTDSGPKHRRPKSGHSINLAESKPWEPMGISRRTWYRRQSKQNSN